MNPINRNFRYINQNKDIYLFMKLCVDKKELYQMVLSILINLNLFLNVKLLGYILSHLSSLALSIVTA